MVLVQVAPPDTVMQYESADFSIELRDAFFQWSEGTNWQSLQ